MSFVRVREKISVEIIYSGTDPESPGLPLKDRLKFRIRLCCSKK
jgi:hypothetical protein